MTDAYEHSDCSPDEIVDMDPELSLQDVHDALAYFYGHPEEFDATPEARSDDEASA